MRVKALEAELSSEKSDNAKLTAEFKAVKAAVSESKRAHEEALAHNETLALRIKALTEEMKINEERYNDSIEQVKREERAAYAAKEQELLKKKNESKADSDTEKLLSEGSYLSPQKSWQACSI